MVDRTEADWEGRHGRQARIPGRRRNGSGGWNREGVPVNGARRVGGPVGSGTLSALAGRGALARGGAVAAAVIGAAVVAGAALAVTVGPAATAEATGTHAKTVKVSTASVAKVGTVLTTASGLTLYRFTEDPPGSSMCTGSCAKIWPPLLAAQGSHIAAPKGVKGLSLIKVGSHWQVAFHRAALYRFEGDKKKGQAKGQDVGGVWFAVLKSGIPASTTAGSASTATTSPSPGSTPTTAAGSSTTPPTSTTPAPRSVTPAPSPSPAVTPATSPPTTPPPTMPPPTTPPTSPPPPPTTPPTSPPATTPTTSGGGGYGY